MPGARTGVVPILSLYGVTASGASVCAHVHGFSAYLWASPPPSMTEADVPAFKDALEARVGGAGAAVRLRGGPGGGGGGGGSSGGGRLPEAILAVHLVPGLQSLLGYHGGRTQPMLRIYVALPSLISATKSALEAGMSFGSFPSRSYTVFEANIPFELRFMVDGGVTGCNGVEAPAGAWAPRPASRRRTSAQVELDVVYDQLVSHAPDGPWQKVAPLRILSFDIECCGRKGLFPEPEHDPVIQIGNVVTVQGASSSICRSVFVMGSCSPIVGARVFSFDDETQMLEAWAAFVREADPDIVTGYNIANFDLPYLLRRAVKLKSDRAQMLGRLQGAKATMRDTTFQSSAYGKRENIETTIAGRVVFDMLAYIRRDHKLSSYSLNSVSAHFLGQQKEDVHHSIIADLQGGSADDRRRLAVYCLKDSFLPQKLMDKLMVVINHIEMARVVGVPLDYLLSRGQQIKVMSMLLRKAKPLGLLVPTLAKVGSGDAGGGGGDEGYEGATVIEPLRGFYDEPIATLDFASLYPSIMMAHNLCYSTLVAPEDARALPPGAVEKTPGENIHFATAAVVKGVLPAILEELLAARKRAKADMAKATDPFVIAVQNGRQLALKVSANSVYGFTGATVGMLPCLAISATVTAYGRTMIDTTKKAVEETFRVANGYPADAVVVYGDTDSVMVKFGVRDVAAAMALGAEAAKTVTKLFPPPIKLEFEKVYYPFLLMNKKRYAGMYWSKPTAFDKMDTKGIETVRRDNCALVRRVIDTVLQLVLIEHSVPRAVAYVKQVVADLLQDRIDLSVLVITKALGKSASADDYVAKQAHVELAERMRKRDPASAPAVGDRVPYVIIEAAKGTPNYMRSEDPIYALENNIPIDFRYYLENQLEKPLTRIFEGILNNPHAELFSGDHMRSITVREREGEREHGVVTFAGAPPPRPPHLSSLHPFLIIFVVFFFPQKKSPTAGVGIMAFAVKTLKCLSCKAPVSEGTTCAHCKHREAEVYRRQLALVNEAEEKFSRLWTQCQRCQGSLHQDVLCTSRDCPLFYMRKKVAKDLAEVTEGLARFGW